MGQTTSDVNNIPGAYDIVNPHMHRIGQEDSGMRANVFDRSLGSGLGYSYREAPSKYDMEHRPWYEPDPAYIEVHKVADKNIWGPVTWKHLHMIAIRYPNNPTVTDRHQAFTNIMATIDALPCAVCQLHAMDYLLKKGTGPNALDMCNSFAFQKWVFTFHNVVNERLGKRVISWEEYRRMYHSYMR
jgi:FAD-linked sulfhydryl oxidase